MTYIILVVVFSFLLLAGVAAAFVPFLPALPYMLLVSGAFVLFDGFIHLSGLELSVLAFLAVVSIIIDKAAGVLGARFGGASGKSLLWGILGLLAGTVVLPPFGGLLGMFIAIVASEIILGRSRSGALKAGMGSLAGSFAGMAATVVVAVLFLILFILFVI